MKTFAHIETGAVLDPIVAVDEAAYRRRFSDEIVQGWQIVEVPDGTVSGSVSDGQGGWTAPAVAVPILQPITMGGSSFHNYCALVLSQVNSISPLAGMSRMGDIINSLETAAGQGGLCRIAFERYRAAGVPGGKYELADLTQLMGALQQAGIVTAQESATLITQWPKQ